MLLTIMFIQFTCDFIIISISHREFFFIVGSVHRGSSLGPRRHDARRIYSEDPLRQLTRDLVAPWSRREVQTSADLPLPSVQDERPARDAQYDWALDQLRTDARYSIRPTRTALDQPWCCHSVSAERLRKHMCTINATWTSFNECHLLLVTVEGTQISHSSGVAS